MPIPPLKLDKFGGTVPIIDDRLLPDNAASVAVNTWLFSGRIEPIHSLVAIHTMSDQNKKGFFRLPKASPSIDNMTASWWLEFTDPKIRVIRSPIAGQDDDGRYYWADGDYPKMMTGTMIETGATPLKLGVPAPEVAPSIAVSGGTGTDQKTVDYVYTWVTANGEEGPPSPAGEATGLLDATYTLTLTAPTAGDTANRALTHTRIYRTVVSAQGVATFFFVAEIPIATLTYVDNCAITTDAVIINNEQLQTLYWTGPPADLVALVTMPNGMIAGWRKNEVWFCEPYYPHAWPVVYVIAVDPEIVGLGVYDQSLIILTDGQPYAATGVDPQSMALSKIQPLEVCLSRLSIVNTPNGVLYASPNGLINITPTGAANLTSKMLTKDQWNKLLNLPSLAAAIVTTGYYGYALATPGVFQADTFQTDAFQQMSEFGTQAGIFLALDDQRMGLTRLQPLPSTVDNVVVDIFNGEIMVLRDGVVYVVDLRKLEPYANYRWRSKIFTLPYLQNLGAAKVYWTPPYVPKPCPSTVFRMYASDRADALSSGLPLRFQKTLSVQNEMFRLPSGFKALYYQFEVEGVAVIDAIHIAQTPHELRAI